jgi:transcriptional regulator with XRE-family HTH domain
MFTSIQEKDSEDDGDGDSNSEDDSDSNNNNKKETLKSILEKKLLNIPHDLISSEYVVMLNYQQLENMIKIQIRREKHSNSTQRYDTEKKFFYYLSIPMPRNGNPVEFTCFDDCLKFLIEIQMPIKDINLWLFLFNFRSLKPEIFKRDAVICKYIYKNKYDINEINKALKKQKHPCLNIFSNEPIITIRKSKSKIEKMLIHYFEQLKKILTVKEIAEITGFNYKNISQYLNGKRRITAEYNKNFALKITLLINSHLRIGIDPCVSLLESFEYNLSEEVRYKVIRDCIEKFMGPLETNKELIKHNKRWSMYGKYKAKSKVKSKAKDVP